MSRHAECGGVKRSSGLRWNRANPATLMPILSDASIADADSGTYQIRGQVVAANRVSAWPTMNTWVCLTRWECEGRVCYGDLQEVPWHDFTHRLLAAR